MRLVAILLLSLILPGCSLLGDKQEDPFRGAYWAEAHDGFPAMCTQDNKCFALSEGDKRHFARNMREWLDGRSD